MARRRAWHRRSQDGTSCQPKPLVLPSFSRLKLLAPVGKPLFTSLRCFVSRLD